MVRVRRDVGTTTRFAKVVLVALFFASCASKTPAPESTPSPPARPPPRVVASVPPAVVDAGPPVPELPRTISFDAFGEGERIADLTAIGAGDRMLLGWVTYFDEGSAALRKQKTTRGKGAASDPVKQGASVVVRALDKDGEALSPPKVVSSKAVSFGGVALARGAQGDVALAWVGKEGGLGQLFVTKLSETGDKLAQKMVTRSKTGCSDVALAALSDGFLAAWVESRPDKSEIFVAKIGRDLNRVGAELRVAETKGETSDVRVASRGDEALVVWSEARGEGEGGIGAARISTLDLTVRGDPALVLHAVGHARSVDLSRFGDGLELAWVEDAPSTPNAGAPGRAVIGARLDSAAKSPSGRTAIPVAADPSSVALDCDRVCRVVVPVAERGELSIYGFSYDGSQKSVARRIATLSGVSTEDTSPVIVKDWLFFAEDNLRGAGRIRKAKLAW